MNTEENNIPKSDPEQSETNSPSEKASKDRGLPFVEATPELFSEPAPSYIDLPKDKWVMSILEKSLNVTLTLSYRLLLAKAATLDEVRAIWKSFGHIRPNIAEHYLFQLDKMVSKSSPASPPPASQGRN